MTLIMNISKWLNKVEIFLYLKPNQVIFFEVKFLREDSVEKKPLNEDLAKFV